MRSMFAFHRLAVLAGCALVAVSCIAVSFTVLAAEPPKPQGGEDFFRQLSQAGAANPQRMFEQFFGEDTPAQREALEAIEVSLEEEQRCGKQAAEAFLDSLRQRKVRVLTRGREVHYLQALVDTLKPLLRNADRYTSIRVVLAKSPEADARSFPGGTLVFSEGILGFADNEAALIGVVGHELSHLDRGHQLVHIKRMTQAQKLFSGQGQPKNPVEMFAASQSFQRMWSRPFRPEDERVADQDAADWAYKAGYDPRELARLLLRLHERNQQTVQANDFLPSFLRSHPYERERYEAVLKRYDELQQAQPRDDLYIGAENLRRRVPRSQQEFPE